MLVPYENDTQEFRSILDFLRFGLTRAEEANLYYGHGTDNAWDDILSLILSTLSLPFECDRLLWQAQLTTDEKSLTPCAAEPRRSPSNRHRDVLMVIGRNRGAG